MRILSTIYLTVCLLLFCSHNLLADNKPISIKISEYGDYSRIVIDIANSNLANIARDNKQFQFNFLPNITKNDIEFTKSAYQHFSTASLQVKDNGLSFIARLKLAGQSYKFTDFPADNHIGMRYVIDAYKLSDIQAKAYKQTAQIIGDLAQAKSNNSKMQHGISNIQSQASNEISNIAIQKTRDIIKSTIGNHDNILASAGANILSDIGGQAVGFATKNTTATNKTNDKAIKLQLSQTAINSSLSQLKSLGQQMNLTGLSHFEGEVTLHSDGKPEYSFLTVIPLHETPEMRHNIFSQLGINQRKDILTKDRTTFNLGTGYRYLTLDEKWLLGTNIFLDHESQLNHNRLSIGAEAISSLTGIRGNIYQPLSDWKERSDTRQEKALQGLDIEFSGKFPTNTQLEGFIKGYWWNKTKQWNEKHNDIFGHQLSLEYSPYQFLTLRGAYDNNNQNKANIELGMQFKYKLGQGLDYFQDYTPPKLTDISATRFQKVRRENTIRTQSRQHEKTVGTITFNNGNNTATRNGITRNIALNSYILEGDRIQIEDTVGDTATVTITFGSGAILDIGDGSVVDIGIDTVTIISGVVNYNANGAPPITFNTPGGSISLVQ